MKLAPIALFTYNRLHHTRLTVEALKNNSIAISSDLYIFSDGNKNEDDLKLVNDVRKYIESIEGFKSINIIKQSKNLGLANSIISGVSHILDQYESIIVLEDDIVTSPHFLKFMNDALNLYENKNRVGCITGYVYPSKCNLPDTFFLRGADCWGWATWKRSWKLFNSNGKDLLVELKSEKLINEFNSSFTGDFSFVKMLENQIAGLNDSWAIRWHASLYLYNMLTLFPGNSLVKNIGCDGSGVHCSSSVNNQKLVTDIYRDRDAVRVEKIPINHSFYAERLIKNNFKYHPLTLVRLLQKIKMIIKTILIRNKIFL